MRWQFFLRHLKPPFCAFANLLRCYPCIRRCYLCHRKLVGYAPQGNLFVLTTSPCFLPHLISFAPTSECRTGQIPGLVAVPISGAVLDATGSWTVVFVIPICLYAVGALTFTLMGSAEELVVYDSLP